MHRVIVPLVASLLALGCVVASAAVRQTGSPDLREAISKGASVANDFPMDFGAYVQGSDASLLDQLAATSTAHAPVPEGPYGWNLRIPTGTNHALLWYGQPYQLTAWEGVAMANTLNGLHDGELTRPIRLHFIVPRPSGDIDSCASWWDATGLHTVKPQVVDSAPHVVLTCDIPAIGAYTSLTIALDFDWQSAQTIDTLQGISAVAIENQNFPIVSLDVPLGDLGPAQELTVDVFTPAGATVIASTPEPHAVTPIEGRWVLSPDDSVFITRSDNFRRGLLGATEQLLLLAAGAFLAIGIERIFRDRSSAPHAA